MKKFKLVVLGILVALAAIIFLQNQDPVIFNILFWHIYASKMLAFLIMIAIGFLAGLFIQLLWRRK